MSIYNPWALQHPCNRKIFPVENHYVHNRSQLASCRSDNPVRLRCRETAPFDGPVAGRFEDVPGRSRAGSDRSGPARVRRKLCAGRRRQDRRCRKSATGPDAGMAFHRPDPEQQDAAHRRELPVGAHGRTVEDRAAPVGTAPGRTGPAGHLPASEHQRRSHQKWREAGRAGGPGEGRRPAAEPAPARADGDPGTAGRSGPAAGPVRAPARARARHRQGRHPPRHAVDGHVRRPAIGRAGRRDHRPHRQRHLRRASL
ncbi:hypothetical protein Lal_00015082 [Lupinus albus]|nr:hypothetical protein Lal_00015082 [Lupinus albus]